MARLDKIQAAEVIDVLGLALIGVYAFCSAIFASDFSEIAVQLSCLNFPIFIGEIILFVALVLLITKLSILDGWKKWHLYWGIYIVCFVVYALFGYSQWGPLSFRNAAMFYYVCFTLLGYSFFNRRLLANHVLTMIILVFLVAMVSLKQIGNYYWYTCIILMAVLIIKRISSSKQFLLISLVFLFSHLDSLFTGSRAHMAGIVCAVFFLICIWLMCLCRFSWKAKGAIFAGMIILFAVGLWKIADHNAVKSLSDWTIIVKRYQEGREYIRTHRQAYGHTSSVCKVYHRNRSAVTVQPSSERPLTVSNNIPVQDTAILSSQGSVEKILEQRMQQAFALPSSEDRDLNIAVNNILFRLFVWTDMWEEVWPQYVITGVGFGKPQRSISLETLQWAKEEWSRDGWVAPHNFFFHVVYRAGIIGILLLAGLIGMIVYLTRVFIARKDECGLLLVSVLIYWCVQSTFSVTMELPHYAILFWSLFGMMVAYAFPKQES